MLSRNADSLYWTGRYMERADFLARILEAAVRLATLPADDAGTSAWSGGLAGHRGAHNECFVGRRVPTTSGTGASGSGSESSAGAASEMRYSASCVRSWRLRAVMSWTM